jgi:hypothetical protein
LAYWSPIVSLEQCPGSVSSVPGHKSSCLFRSYFCPDQVITDRRRHTERVCLVFPATPRAPPRENSHLTSTSCFRRGFLRLPIRGFTVANCTVLYRYVLSQLPTHPQIPSDCGWNALAVTFLSMSRFSCMCQIPLRAPPPRDRVHGRRHGPLSCRIIPSHPLIMCKFNLHNPPPPFRSFHLHLPLCSLILRHITIGLGVLARHHRSHQP